MRAVNLIPADQRQSTAPSAGRSQGAAYAVLVLLAGVAILALVYGIARHQVSRRTAQIATLGAETRQAEAATQQLAPYTQFIALREQRKQAVSELADSRFDWAHAFHELGRVLPSNVSLVTVTGAIGSASGSSSSGSSSSSSSTAAAGSSAVTSATPAGSVAIFSLNGCTTSQAAVAVTLDRLRLMDGVQQVTLGSSTKTTGSGGAAGGCAGGDYAFSATIYFDPLPSSSSSPSSAQTPVSTGGAG